jgi:ribosomal protein S18 acetylase RimI-like enzyme
MVRFTPMSAEDYRQFVVWAKQDYAQQQIKAGAWRSDRADALAEQAFAALLPEGQSSPNQHLCVLERVEDRQRLGYLWYGIRDDGGDRFAALYDLVIFEAHRRQGYGSDALRELERQVRSQGIHRLALQVFGHNDGARALYKKMGYVERTVAMVKDLTS